MCSLSGADVLVESGAALVVQNNTATSLYGGGVYLESEGSTFTATGDGTRVTFESNTAGESGGGICSVDGADVLIESGAALVIQKNRCTRDGAGVLVLGQGASLTVVDLATRIYFLNNTATYNGRKNTAGGGGLSVGSGASAMITSPSLFRGNHADAGAGGAVVLRGDDNDDGASACVSVVLEIIVNSLTTKRSLKVQTLPLSIPIPTLMRRTFRDQNFHLAALLHPLRQI